MFSFIWLNPHDVLNKIRMINNCTKHLSLKSIDNELGPSPFNLFPSQLVSDLLVTHEKHAWSKYNLNPNTSALSKGKSLTFAPVWTLILPMAMSVANPSVGLSLYTDLRKVTKIMSIALPALHLVHIAICTNLVIWYERIQYLLLERKKTLESIPTQWNHFSG